MNMNDDELIKRVAVMWVDGGGDADGIDWCHQKIKDAVSVEIENRVINAKI